MSHWRFFRFGLALFLFFSLSSGDLWRVALGFIPAVAETVSDAAVDDIPGDQSPGTDPEEEPSEGGDDGSEMDPNG